MSKPKSESLFHFTKNIEFLKSILVNGLYPRYCQEDLSWFKLDDHVSYPFSSFCDIPLSRISEHANFYGTYGLGFSKSWGLKNNLNPVIYCESDGLIPKVSDYMIKEIDGETDEQQKEREINLWRLVKLVKPLTGSMIIGGTIVEKDFYQENEWRYIPDEDIDSTVLFKEDYEKLKDENNKKMEEFKLEFSPNDIKYIFVKNDSDIPSIVDFINHNLAHYSANDLKILNSRIISLDAVETDL